MYWTTNTYDGIGRTKSVQAPDTSTSTYLYSGATVTTTDPATKWKKFTTDSAGNLTQVNEPNPAGGADFVTNYTYDMLNRLRTVSMPRSNGTQTRTFNYTGALMTSATNPENGTVFNYYNPLDNTLSYKIDAKGQLIYYAYDQYKRVTQISKYPDGSTEDICQRVVYNYETNPDISSYPYNVNLKGRLTSVHYGGAGCQAVGANSLTGNNYVEMYAYSQAGQVTNKRLRLSRWTGAGGLASGTGTFSPINPSPNGSLDSGTCSGITGWAADTNRLNQSVSISLWEGGTLVSRMKASALRGDVGAYLGDNGLHGFTFPIPAPYANGVSHTLKVIFDGGGVQLGSNVTLTCSGPATNYTGWVDSATCSGGISGWAADRNRLNVSIAVTVWDGSTEVTAQAATASRGDVGSLLGDNGLHGYTIPIPSNYQDGASHTLQVRYETSSTQLPVSPVTFTCGGGGTPTAVSADLEAAYTYNQEGMMISESYPLGTTYQYTYDAMGRPTKMTDTGTSQDLVSTVSYGPEGELLTMTGTSVGETRTYNSMGQLTELTGLNNVHLKYSYTAGANNGQIASQQDVVSGETITYAYDSLTRLSSATSTVGWNQAFAYDGFGNLTGKTGSGIAPVGTYSADPATNRLSGVPYDLNGNQLSANGSSLAYDVMNRTTASTASSFQGFYEYGAANERVYQQKQHYNGSAWVTDATEFYFYGLSGKKIGAYTATASGSGSGASVTWSAGATQVFFGSKLIKNSSGSTQEDIRASVGKYFPYGEEVTNPPTPNDAVKFATYTRDSVSGLDYADHRYYTPGVARFCSADPFQGGVDLLAPNSWNAFGYSGSDPIDNNDPLGLCDVVMAGVTQNASNGAGVQEYADSSGAVSVYPYAGASNTSNLLMHVASAYVGVLQAAAQAFAPTSSTFAAVEGLLAAAADGKTINVTTFSGGAAAFTAAVNFLNNNGGADVTALIGNITYVAPGALGNLYNNGNVAVIDGGVSNTIVGATSGVSPGPPVQYFKDQNNCGHWFGCLADEFSDLLANRSGPDCSHRQIINQRFLMPGVQGLGVGPFNWLNILGIYGPLCTTCTVNTVPPAHLPTIWIGR